MKCESSWRNSRTGLAFLRARQMILTLIQWLGHMSSKDTALVESNGKLLQVCLAKET